MTRALEQAAEWLVTLNDAGATEADFAAWQVWLARHPAHLQAFQEVQETWRRSASVAGLRGPELYATADRPRRRAAPWVFALAASLALMAVTLPMLWSRPHTISTEVTEQRSLTLADGTLVSLGPKTVLDIQYSEQRRLIDMRGGEAYFDVRREPARPFVVQTAKGQITALGTAFSVNAHDSRLAVTVTEGKVRIDWLQESGPASGQRAAAPEPVVLTAGDKYAREGTQVRTRKIEPMADALGWLRGRLEYQDETLRTVIADLNRYSPIVVALHDPSLGDLRYTGTVFPDSLDVWLDSLQGVFPLKIERSERERLLVAQPRPDPER